MTAPAWTPGPWFYEPADRGRLCTVKVRAHEGGNGEAIARHVELDNARLIAAAPELYEALQRLFRDYRTEGCPDPECRVCAASKIAEAVAYAALAKARGEQ